VGRVVGRMSVLGVDPGADYEDRTVGTPIGHLIAQAGSAAARIADQRAECEARKEYAARIERETQAQPEHTRETQPSTTRKWSCRSAPVAQYPSARGD
jgi:hypothetical protein